MKGNPDGFPVTARVCRKPCGGDRTPHLLSIQFSCGLSRCWVLLCPSPKGVLQLDEHLAGFPHPSTWHPGLG